MLLEDIQVGMKLCGLTPAGWAKVVGIEWPGADAIKVTFEPDSGGVAQKVIYREDEDGLTVAATRRRPFTADADQFALVLEAQRITMAGVCDVMPAVTTSDIQPLPHQIRAVYGELLPRTPLRFLLADDPGAGKTIMAGLYIKELILRDDVKRCLIVAPGGLVDQWVDELFYKFGLRFEILTTATADSRPVGTVFDAHPLLVARMDQLARNESLMDELANSVWDLVIVDEAHRMGAHYFGGKLNLTKRYELGQTLGDIARHFLLMTATPHSGKEENFQLFMALLDRDRFSGKFTRGAHQEDTRGVMRRMVKEDLLTFEGKPLFPERVAETVPYELTADEAELYDEVTRYVREGMNRADKIGGKRRNTVGFALTVLQRRLASSPEAIYKSLVRRTERLRKRREEVLNGEPINPDYPDIRMNDLEDCDEWAADALEQAEEMLVDSATVAQTLEELDVEIGELAYLTEMAKRVRDHGEDRKWTELRTILEDETLVRQETQVRRKLIVFTEHRDTLEYLKTKVAALLGRPEAVQTIHGGVRRDERRRITEEFSKNPNCQILIATDAAGEGLNLQAAHLMVNYDLPWNPNRIEQRFGRVHRIGQRDVCRLWNLVASNTREGEVFTRLLGKIEEQRKAYGGKVFDVLGLAFEGTPLRDLLIDAIRYGDLPEKREQMEKVVDATVDQGLKDLLEEHALARDAMPTLDITSMRRQMDEARARRLQPHFIEGAFRKAFSRLGGRLAAREAGRFEITRVPPAVLAERTVVPLASRYNRVTFDLGKIDHPSAPRADLLAPGHPLHDAVMAMTIRQGRDVIEQGTVLVSATLEKPHVLVGVLEEAVDGTGTVVSRRFAYNYVDPNGKITVAGPAPYLDCVGAPKSEAVDQAREWHWVGEAEESALNHVLSERGPEFLAEIRARRLPELQHTRTQVEMRLTSEINRLASEALNAESQVASGGKASESPEGLHRKRAELQHRLTERLAVIDQQMKVSVSPARVISAALVLPASSVEDDLPHDAPLHARDTKAVERRGVEAVLKAERGLGRRPTEQPFNNPGFDILSEHDDDDPIRIEVKARVAGAKDFYVTYNEVLLGRNAAPRYRLAMVRVSPDGPEYDEIRYIEEPFMGTDAGALSATGISADWNGTWAKGRAPF